MTFLGNAESRRDFDGDLAAKFNLVELMIAIDDHAERDKVIGVDPRKKERVLFIEGHTRKPTVIIHEFQ